MGGGKRRWEERRGRGRGGGGRELARRRWCQNGGGGSGVGKEEDEEGVANQVAEDEQELQEQKQEGETGKGRTKITFILAYTVILNGRQGCNSLSVVPKSDQCNQPNHHRDTGYDHNQIAT